MRTGVFYIVAIGATILAVAVLLPVLGALFLLAALVLGGLAVAVLAAPLLAKLPWFRDRIVVQRDGNRQTIRFGRGAFHRGGNPYQGDPVPPTRLDDGDVIDITGRELPDDD